MKYFDKHDIGPEIGWIAASWAISLVALCALACKGTDTTPDEFHVTYGQGTADGAVGARDTSSFVEGGSVGLTWHIGDVTKREHEAEYIATLHAIADRPIVVEPVAEPVVVEPLVPEPAPESEHVQPPAPNDTGYPAWVTATLAALSIAATALGVLNKLGRINLLCPKDH